MSIAARITIIGAVALICGGAVYLTLTRGPTLLIDLSAAAAQIVCF